MLLALDADKVPDFTPEVSNVLHAPLVQVFVVIKVEAVFAVYDGLEAVHLSAFWVGVTPEFDGICDGVPDHGRASGRARSAGASDIVGVRSLGGESAVGKALIGHSCVYKGQRDEQNCAVKEKCSEAEDGRERQARSRCVRRRDCLQRDNDTSRHNS